MELDFNHHQYLGEKLCENADEIFLKLQGTYPKGKSHIILYVVGDFVMLGAF